MKKKRKIAIITGTRAEYGLLYWIIKGIQDDPQLELQLIVTGMHLSPEFGLTVREIEKDGFAISEKIYMLLSSDTEEAIAVSMGVGMIGFANAYERLKPDILVVLGDRFEILSAAAASIPFGIPIAHIHGGEATEGIIDEAIRHATTKMSHIHFTATEKYRQRVIQMGELPSRVYRFGSPGLDYIYKCRLIKKDLLFNQLGLPNDKRIGTITYHPVTLGKNITAFQISEILEAILSFADIYWVFTFPNADTYGRAITERIKEFVNKYPNKGKVFISLGQLRYLSLLKYADLMVGNSSSGLTQAPSFELPVVNIGDRQRGRIQAHNVIDVPRCKKDEIIKAIKMAISPIFKRSLKGMKNPYGNEPVSEKIVKVLKTISLNENLLKKRFHEILK